jgi:alkylation response protein AidB-like acyl-CoA dehydrogenase
MYSELDSEVLKDETISMLKKQVHEFAEKEMRPASIALDRMDPQEVIEDGSPYFQVFGKMKKMGLHKMYTPAEYGGLGFSAKQVHAVIEELGWGSMGLTAGLGVDAILPSIAAVFNDMTAGALDECVELITRPWMDDDKGELRGCVPFTEPEHGSDIVMSPHLPAERLDTFGLRNPVKLEKDGDGWVVNGMKAAWPTAAPVATHCFASLNMQPHRNVADQAFAFISLDQEGVSRGAPLDKLGMRDVPQGELVFDDVRVSKQYVIVVPGMWSAAAAPMLALMGTGTGVVAVGLARAAFEEAMRYCKERVQGGKPIIEHDTVLMRLAAMFQNVETARAYSRLVLDYAFGQMFEEREFDFPAMNCHACKVYCTQQAYEVASEAMRLHGAYGLTKDALVEKLFRDARMGLSTEGCNDVESLISGHGLSEHYSLD